jgi:hypothetical protein
MPLDGRNVNVVARSVGLSHEACHPILQVGQVSGRVGNVLRGHDLLRRVNLQVGRGIGQLQWISGRVRKDPPGVLGKLLQVVFLRHPPHGLNL